MIFADSVWFGSLTNLFLLGWLMLAVACLLPQGSTSRRYLLTAGGRVVPVLLLVVFVVGYAMTRHLPGSVTSLEGVLTTLSVPEKAALAWYEAIGLALLVARWIIDDASTLAVNRFLVLVCLVGALFASAIGIVVYLPIRWYYRDRADAG